MDSLIVVFGGALLATGIGLAIWALFWDRARGQRRCPKCWHDLSYTPGSVCGECGYTANKEKHLFRTRRHWRWTFVGAIAFLAGYSLCVTPRVNRSEYGWPGAVPAMVLIVTYPWLGDPEGALDYELGARAAGGEMWGWQGKWLSRRCVAILSNSKDGGTRARAADLLGLIGQDARGTSEAIIQALKDPEAEVRISLTAALGLIQADGDSSVPVLISLLSDESGVVRERAAWALWMYSEEAEPAVPALTRALEDESEAVRAWSAIALSKIVPERQGVIPAVAETLLNASQRHLRLAAVFALDDLDTRFGEAVPALTTVLRDDDATLQLYALQALAKCGPDAASAVPVLIEIVEDNDANWRTWAVFALGAIGPQAEAAVPLLHNLLDECHEDDEFCQAVKYALNSIGGNP